MTDDDYDALSQKQLASIKRDMRISLEDAAVRATHKVMAEIKFDDGSPVQEDAFEGWVKIDELREHFDSVGCGTIYKHGGEGRVLLRATPPKREWQGLTDEELQFYRKKYSKLFNAGYDKVTDTNLISEAFDSAGFYKEVEAVLKERNK